MRLTGRATVVGITLLPSIAEDSKACDTKGDGQAAAVIVDVGTDQHQALQNAERKAGTCSGKTLLRLASLLFLWLASLWLACTLLSVK